MKPAPLTRPVKLFPKGSFYSLPKVFSADTIESGEEPIKAPWREESPPAVALARDGGWWVRSDYYYQFTRMTEDEFHGVTELLGTRGLVRLWCKSGMADLRADAIDFVHDFGVLGAIITLQWHHSDTFCRGDQVQVGNSWWRVVGTTPGVKHTLLSLTLVSSSAPEGAFLDTLLGGADAGDAAVESELDKILGVD